MKPTDELSPWFLGAWAENNDVFESVLLELVRDHVFWRRHFHPEDLPPISTHAQVSPAHQAQVASMKRELHRLTAQLKRSVPAFHPRYLGHMMSDLLLPGLIAQLVTTLYNPNNIIEEVAPVTLGLEYEVGQQLCRMVGFSVDGTRTPCGSGHLTSGGTLANDEALWLARAVKLLPLALKDACLATGHWVDETLKHADDWELLGWPVSRCLDLAALAQRTPALSQALEAARVETRGLARFSADHPLLETMVVLAPATAHYSWNKAMRLLGLGTAQLTLIPTHEGRMDIEALDLELERCAKTRAPVLAVIGVYGTTEFGTFDELHQIVDCTRGRSFWFHVDAAWGGYVPSLFRQPDGQLRPREAIAAEFRHFPSERVYRSTEALASADSITVDPHKLGFVPYGAGAFLARDRRAFDLSMQHAAYVFHSPVDDDARYRNAGRFSLEGSRPGAAAAAVAINHRVLPLDADHFGRLIARSIHACEGLFDRVPSLARRLEGVAQVATPFEPDCNVLSLAFNPAGNRSLAVANAFTRQLARELSSTEKGPPSFFGSYTTVALAHLGLPERQRLGALLQLELNEPDADGLFVLRHTLMNPWLLSPVAEPGGQTYLDAYLDHLEQLARTLRPGSGRTADQR